MAAVMERKAPATVSLGQAVRTAARRMVTNILVGAASRKWLGGRPTDERDVPVSESIHPDQRSPTMPEPLPLFLFSGMGGYDPKLVDVGIACQEAVSTVQIAYPNWRTLRKAPDFDLETLVTDVVGQITKHCAPCAVLLAGYSFGGVVAFAAATRLRREGYTVRFLGLLDVEAQPGLDAAPGALRAPKTRWQQLTGFIAAMRRGEAPSKLAYVSARHLKSPRLRRLLNFYARVPRRWLRGKFMVYLDRDLLSEHMEPLLRQWIARRNTLQPLPIPVYLFRTEQHSASAPRHLGWDHHCPDLTVISMPGTHLGMLGSSNRPALCAAFRSAVFEALGRTPSEISPTYGTSD